MKENVNQSVLPKNQREKGSSISRRSFLKSVGAMGFSLSGLDQADKLEKAIYYFSDRSNKKNEEVKSPDIKTNLVYLRHSASESLRPLREKIEDADVYVPEICGWLDEELVGYQQVSNGQSTPEQFLKSMNANPYHPAYNSRLEELSILHKKHAKIEMVDLKMYSKEHEKYYLERKNIKPYNLKGEFDQLLETYKENMAKLAETYMAREEVILENLEKLYKKIKNREIPSIKDKNNVKILMVLGALHTPVSHVLIRSDKNVSRTITPMPHIFGYSMETIRGYMFNRPPDDDTAARGILKAITPEFVQMKLKETGITTNDYDLEIFLNRIINQLNVSEISAIFKNAQTNYKYLKFGLYDELVKTLNQKGIKMPSSEQEFTSIINFYDRGKKEDNRRINRNNGKHYNK